MPPATWSVTLEDDPDPADRDAILGPLLAANEAAVGPSGRAALAVLVRDPAGTVVGGLWGRSGYGHLFVELLAMGAARGHGLGRQVMALAEAEARRRNLQGIWLDTFTFQAEGFYKKLGFTEFGRITGYPPGHDRIFLIKRLNNA